MLTGPAEVVRAELARHPDAGQLDIRVVDAPEVVGMDESPTAALRRKSRTSIRQAADSVAGGEAAALVSAGHTGATVMAAHAAFGMLPGVDRPALAATIPSGDRLGILLDVGANADCRAAHLLQFAVMGSVYAKVSLGIERPRIGLLSIGEEAGKGNELIRDAHRLLKGSTLNFIGNVEAREVYKGNADVIVCDGFTGNIALKASEGLVDTVERLLERRIVEDVFGNGGIAALAPRVPPLQATARLFGVRRRAAARRRRRLHRRPRPLVGEGRSQRRRDGSPVRRPPGFIQRVESEIAAASVNR